MTDADISQRISAEQLHAQRLASVEKLLGEHDEAVTALDRHRERSETRWGLISGVVGALGILALGVAGGSGTLGAIVALGAFHRWIKPAIRAGVTVDADDLTIAAQELVSL